MSLFWKKLAGNGSPKITNESPVHSNSPRSNGVSTLANHQLSINTRGECGILRRSRLSINFEEVLKDASARQYFLSFLEVNESAHLLSFYLDVESFEASAKSRLQAQLRHNKTQSVEAINIENDTQNNVLLNLHKSITEDAVKIFTRYLSKDATDAIKISDEERDKIASEICSENGCCNTSCFVKIKGFMYNSLDKDYFSLFSSSVYYCKYQLDVLTAGSISILDILYNENALLYFMEFMEQEGERDLVEFWLTTDNFYQHYVTVDGTQYEPTQIQEDAMVIYDKYFSLQALCPLGFSDEIRYKVEESICRVGGPLPTCFDDPTQLVLNVLQTTYQQPFLNSQIYVKYLTELVSLVQFKSYNSNRRGSDVSSSAESTHTTNTLLAMDGSQPGAKKIIKKFEDEDMQIDTTQFVPDALWRRPLSGKLRMGYINNMGQFITEFEPQPDKRKSTETKIKEAVKKLVYKNEDKAKEEMAYQVAKMIINEVTSVTLKRTFYGDT